MEACNFRSIDIYLRCVEFVYICLRKLVSNEQSKIEITVNGCLCSSGCFHSLFIHKFPNGSILFNCCCLWLEQFFAGLKTPLPVYAMCPWLQHSLGIDVWKIVQQAYKTSKVQ